MTKSVRRVVIGQNQSNKSVIIEDKPADNIDHFMKGVKNAVSINLWATKGLPNLDYYEDPAKNPIPFLPEPHGSVFRICDIPPDTSFMDRLDEIMLNDQKITDEQKKSRHPMMHQVSALSYAIVLEGEVTLLLDDNETRLKAGDVVIDCGSRHAWSNQSDKVCRMMFVMQGATRK